MEVGNSINFSGCYLSHADAYFPKRKCKKKNFLSCPNFPPTIFNKFLNGEYSSIPNTFLHKGEHCNLSKPPQERTQWNLFITYYTSTKREHAVERSLKPSGWLEHTNLSKANRSGPRSEARVTCLLWCIRDSFWNSSLPENRISKGRSRQVRNGKIALSSIRSDSNHTEARTTGSLMGQLSELRRAYDAPYLVNRLQNCVALDIAAVAVDIAEVLDHFCENMCSVETDLRIATEVFAPLYG